jgi:hypothetical protein
VTDLCCEPASEDDDDPAPDPPDAENFVLYSPEEYEEAYLRLYGRRPPAG